MDDLSGKISELFSNPESMEKIRSIMGMLGVADSEEKHEERREERHEEKKSSDFDLPFDSDTLLKITKAFSMLKQDDPKVQFLLALKPNLSDERSKKVDEAIHLLKLINLIPLLQEGILQ